MKTTTIAPTSSADPRLATAADQLAFQRTLLAEATEKLAAAKAAFDAAGAIEAQAEASTRRGFIADLEQRAAQERHEDAKASLRQLYDQRLERCAALAAELERKTTAAIEAIRAAVGPADAAYLTFGEVLHARRDLDLLAACAVAADAAPLTPARDLPATPPPPNLAEVIVALEQTALALVAAPPRLVVPRSVSDSPAELRRKTQQALARYTERNRAALDPALAALLETLSPEAPEDRTAAEQKERERQEHEAAVSETIAKEAIAAQGGERHAL